MWDPVGIVSTFFNMGVATGLCWGLWHCCGRFSSDCSPPSSGWSCGPPSGSPPTCPPGMGWRGPCPFCFPWASGGGSPPAPAPMRSPPICRWRGTTPPPTWSSPGGRRWSCTASTRFSTCWGSMWRGLWAACWYTGRQNKALLTQAGKGLDPHPGRPPGGPAGAAGQRRLRPHLPRPRHQLPHRQKQNQRSAV